MAQINQGVIRALRLALQPLFQLAVRNGLQFKDFSVLAKEGLVEAALNEHRATGSTPTNSSIAVMVGLDRKQVATIRRENIYARSEQHHLITRILEAWRRNPNYTDKQGVPLILPRRLGSPNLTDLIAAFAGDLPVGSIFSEMVRVNAMERVGNDSYRVLAVAYASQPIATELETIVNAGGALNAFGHAILRKLYYQGGT